ncbi:hypothetical protein VNI00_007506 [Paramarasmius palmivorus]|uniref:Uncharacterized protein n=1 Tax=Paramarasmius palmivorus TaxID=297713 RepID=A0AAW0D2B7_9AGAR
MPSTKSSPKKGTSPRKPVGHHAIPKDLVALKPIEPPSMKKVIDALKEEELRKISQVSREFSILGGEYTSVFLYTLKLNLFVAGSSMPVPSTPNRKRTLESHAPSTTPKFPVAYGGPVSEAYVSDVKRKGHSASPFLPQSSKKPKLASNPRDEWAMDVDFPAGTNGVNPRTGIPQNSARNVATSQVLRQEKRKNARG